MSKVFILGIDGGSLKLIEQWQDELPNLKKVMQNGVYGELESTIPPSTCPAWPCMFTGKNPGKLGFYGFVDVQVQEEHKIRLHSSLDYFQQSLWKILSDSSKKVGLFNIPITYPPPEVNGFAISGLGTPFADATKGVYTYPSNLGETLDRVVGGYEIEAVIDMRVAAKEEQYKKALEQILAKRLKAAKYLLTNFDWDLFICVFVVLDRVQHYFWHHMDKAHPGHTTDKYQTVVKDFYKMVDRAMGELVSMLPQGTNILITSDHGFQGAYGQFWVNKWLEKAGFLYFSKSSSLRVKSLLTAKQLFLSKSNPSLTRLVSKMIPRRLLAGLLARSEIKDHLADIFQSIDWSRTKAFGLGPTEAGSMIYINLKGKNPGGIVLPGDEYEQVRQDIIDRLRSMPDPETGEPLDIQVFRKEEIYHGKYLASAPDILFLNNKYRFLGGRREGKSEWQVPTPSRSGMHARQGVFMAYGPDIKKSGEKLPNLKIYDITPTALHMFGLPIPKDMDGRVLTEIFTESSEPGKRQVAYRGVDYEAERTKERVGRLKRLRKL